MFRYILKPFSLFLLSLSLLVLYFLCSLYSPNPDPNASAKTGLSRIPARIPKIYLYDLLKKFTDGVIESYAMARASSGAKYPGHQHSAEWFLYSDLNQVGARFGSPVERVLDPEEADLFYVPFFSSLSLIVNPIRPDGGAKKMAYSDEEMQVENSVKSDVFEAVLLNR